MSHPVGPVPLPTPQTLESIASVEGSRTRGSRWRAAAFFCDLAALLLVAASWATYRQGVASTALVLGSAALIVSTVSLMRSWATPARTPAVVWVVVALAIALVSVIA